MRNDMLMIDGLQYVNWNRELFEEAQKSGVHTIHVTIAYWENIRETSGIITTSLKYAGHFKRHSKSGCVMVNLPTAGTDYHVPFGGRKASSYGPREQGQYARDFYTIIKTNYSKPY